jgi:transcriptional regulator with XRE-family HTH domain
MPSEDTSKPTEKPRAYISIELSSEFGQAFRDARLRAGLTQTDVAKQARVSQTYVSRLELGWQKLTVESMSLLARAVGLDVSLVVTGDERQSGAVFFATNFPPAAL